MRHLLVATVVMAVGCPRPEPVVFEVTANQEPVASMTAPLEVPALVDFSVDGAASFDVDGTITEWSWMFDPGLPPVTGPHATFRYDHPGLFTVELRVTDDGGKRGRARQRIRVLPPPDVEGPLLDAVTLRAAGQLVALAVIRSRRAQAFWTVRENLWAGGHQPCQVDVWLTRIKR